MAVNGMGLGMVTVGGLVLWSGITNKPFKDIFKTLASGKTVPAPANTQATLTSSASTPSAPSSFPMNASIEALWIATGGPRSTAKFASQVAMAESSGNPNATSSNPDGGTNVGLWQLDTPGGVGAGYSIGQLKNPILNARITIKATNGGTNWSQWSDPVVNAA